MLMKLETYNYCRKATNRAKRYFDRTTWVVWANIQIATVRLILSFLVSGTRTGGSDGPILTIYSSYDVFPRKDVPFVGCIDLPPHLGG